MKPVKLEIFSDYLCPFCWLAEPAVHELLKTDPAVEVVWRAFELRPESVPMADPKSDYLRRVWTTSVYPMAESLGITMKQPPLQTRTRVTHQAANWARTQERFDEYHAQIFRAFFERGEDIGEVEVLAALAVELGLDHNSLRQALETREFESKVLEDESAADRLGITGVPAFIANRRAALSGVRPVEHLQQLVNQVRGSE